MEAVAADADAVTDRPVVALHEIEEALGRMDDDGAGRLGGPVENDLAVEGGGKLLGRLVGHVARLVLDRHRHLGLPERLRGQRRNR